MSAPYSVPRQIAELNDMARCVERMAQIVHEMTTLAEFEAAGILETKRVRRMRARLRYEGAMLSLAMPEPSC